MVLNVKTKMSSYDIVIENNIIDKANKYFNLNRKVLIVSDDGVPSIYVDKVKLLCKEAFVFIIKQGENSKNFDNYYSILKYLVENNFTRTDCIVAVGGGVVGDLSGFVASTFNRGIDFYNVPTTFLSQVDSSIGGKTAIDFLSLKNIVGSFYPPKCVLIDPTSLKTLDKRQLNAGIAESIKMAATFNLDLFEYIKNNQVNDEFIFKVIYESLLIKKYVVENDEYEKGIRKVLNFGHSIGHCIESLSNGKLLHGEAVSIGMLFFTSKDVKEKLIEVLNKFNLPTKCLYDHEQIINKLIHDKKASGDMLDIIFVNEIGSYEIKKIKIVDIKNYL